jgi:hypothetical protein
MALIADAKTITTMTTAMITARLLVMMSGGSPFYTE